MEFNIQRQGRKWSRAEVEQKYHQLCPEKIELIEGKMFWSDEQRLNMLALLLENVGIDAATKLILESRRRFLSIPHLGSTRCSPSLQSCASYWDQ